MIAACGLPTPDFSQDVVAIPFRAHAIGTTDRR